MDGSKYKGNQSSTPRPILKIVLYSSLVYALVIAGTGWWWDKEPADFEVLDNASTSATKSDTQMTTGFITTATFIRIAKTLVDIFRIARCPLRIHFQFGGISRNCY